MGHSRVIDVVLGRGTSHAFTHTVCSTMNGSAYTFKFFFRNTRNFKLLRYQLTGSVPEPFPGNPTLCSRLHILKDAGNGNGRT